MNETGSTDFLCSTSSASFLQFDACVYQIIARHSVEVAALDRAFKLHTKSCNISLPPDSAPCPTTQMLETQTQRNKLLLSLLLVIIVALLVIVTVSLRLNAMRTGETSFTEEEPSVDQKLIAMGKTLSSDTQTTSHTNSQCSLV